MKDNKLTPEEVKKALECIQPRILTEKERMAVENALDLINRQQAEVDNLKAERDVMLEDLQFRTNQVIEQQAEVEEMHKRVMRLDSEREEWSRSATAEKLKNIELQAEIERLQIRLRKERHQFEDLGKMYSEIRAEAIKEFADKLKSEITEEFDDCLCLTLYTVMDNLVKEMVGK